MHCTNRRALTLTVAAALVLAACGSSGAPGPSEPGDTLPVTVESTDSTPVDGFRPVESIDEVVSIWVPIEIGGEPVDAAALGAYLQIAAVGSSVRMVGTDGCNRFSGQHVGDAPAIDRGILAEFETESTAQACDVSVQTSLGSGALLSISSDGAEMLADGLQFVGSILYGRLDAIPVDPRQAIWEAEAQADEAARQAEETAEVAAAEQVEAQERERIRTELPDARTRWAEAGVGTYTLRFEVGALKLDPSFPQGRPVGGLWEIEVVDGVATDNEWSNSILGDTVQDWFAYIDSQLDSHYLRVDFDPVLGAPTLIDSQPLDDAVTDPNELAAWLVFAEVVVAS